MSCTKKRAAERAVALENVKRSRIAEEAERRANFKRAEQAERDDPGKYHAVTS